MADSAAYQQDLDAMSAANIREFCKSRISYLPSLGLSGDGTVTTLKVTVKRLDPEDLMEQLGFDDDAKLWAGALFETLEESDAIDEAQLRWGRLLLRRCSVWIGIR